MGDQAPQPPDGPSQWDRMFAGELYIADDPQLAADNLRALTLTRQFNGPGAHSRASEKTGCGFAAISPITG